MVKPKKSQNGKQIFVSDSNNINPFRNKTYEIDAYEFFKVSEIKIRPIFNQFFRKIILMTITLIAPIRFLLIALSITCAYICAMLSLLFLTDAQKRGEMPFGPFRRLIVYPIRLFCRLFLFFLGKSYTINC